MSDAEWKKNSDIFSLLSPRSGNGDAHHRNGAAERIQNAENNLSSDLVELSGEVEKILYENEDSSYCVIRLRDVQGNQQTATGALGGAAPGQTVKLTGKWEIHKEHGRQLKVTHCEFSLPVSNDALIRYLSSGVLPGIGAKYAEAIVEHFGKDTLKILDTASRKLLEVPGLGRKRVEKIREVWKTNSTQREIRIQLQSLGISPSYFARIYKEYGDAAANLIRANPYRLATEIRGIGFLLADRIASQCDFAKSDLRRLLAGISYAFLRMRSGGHLCLPYDDFLRYLANLLEIAPDDAALALHKALEAHIAEQEYDASGTAMIYEPVMKHQEDELPRLLRILIRCKQHAGLKLANVPPPRDAIFSEEQFAAVDKACRSPLSIITGGPGVGKTTVVSELVRRARKAGVQVMLAAPTGRAAKRMEETARLPASTIHRLLKWDPVEGKFVYGRDNRLPQALYVVDESSMLDLPLTVSLFCAIPPGACTVIVGDPDQLPSVGPGNVLNDLIASGICPVSRLTKIFRQGSGSGIIHAAHAVNSGCLPILPAPQDGAVTDFYWIRKEDPEETASIIERLISDRIPKRFGMDPMRDIQLLCPMNRGPLGTRTMNERLQALLNPGGTPSFRTGDRNFRCGDKVMQVTNNYDKNVFNGDMGKLESIDTEESVFSVNYDGRIVDYEFADADQIVPAYAVTVHKSQGCEFPAVVMPLQTSGYLMLQRNLLYTGITRAKRLMILVGSKQAVSMAVRNTVCEPRYSLLLSKLKTIGETIKP